MGLTDKGYQRRTFDDILNYRIQIAKELFGEDIDTSDLAVLGKILRIGAYNDAIMAEELEGVYFSGFIPTATGQNLDRLAPVAGITRNPATAARYSVQVVGTAGAEILAGLLVGTETGLTFYSIKDAVIGTDGTCTVEVACTEPGIVGNVKASTIDSIVNPEASIESVAGIECLSVGVDEESDLDFRVRLETVIRGTGSGSVSSIESALLSVPTVKFAKVVENDGPSTDADGRPPHTFEAYVVGGDDYAQEIGEAIFSKKPMGIATVGDYSVTITDAGGYEKVIKYSKAATVNINVKAVIKVKSAFGSDGITQIQRNVSEYINSLGLGNSLILSSLYGHIYGVTGVAEVTSLQVSTDGGSTYSASNVAIAQYGVATCAAVQVEVTS